MSDLTVKELIKSVKNICSDIIFPENITCYICGGELNEEKNHICNKCYNQLPIIKKHCEKCGCEIYSGKYCVRCKNAALNIDRCFTVCSYDDFVKGIIYRFKNGDRYLGTLLADIMANGLKKSNIAFDIITCVPVTLKVLKFRGYNQSILLAQNIARQLNLPLDIFSLQKVKDTEFQKDLNAKQRLKNLENAFKITDDNIFKDKTVLLIDDVITTGSTLSACGEALKLKGAKTVYCATFAAVSAKVSFG